jgi:FtsH-binding integral membrane protein
MADSNNWLAQGGSVARPDSKATIDAGLRYMAAGIFLTGIVSYFIFTLAVTADPALAAKGVRPLARGLFLTDLGRTLYTTPLAYVLMLAPLAFVFFLSFRVYKMSVTAAQISFWLFAAVMGASLSTIFLRYTGQSITKVFMITAATFGMLSLYGYTTKKDLSGWGTFLFMGVIGRQHRPAVADDAVRYLRDRCAGVRGPHSLRYTADQGQLLRDRPRRDADG